MLTLVFVMRIKIKSLGVSPIRCAKYAQQFSPLRSSLMCASRIWLSIMGQVPCKWQADFGIRTLRDAVDLPFAVLDLHFTEFKKGVFAIATSKGAVCLCTMNVHGTGPIEYLNSYQIFSDSTLTLSFAWNSVPSHSDAIAASSSDGEIAILDTKYQPPMTYTKIEGHSLEAWTVAWTSKGAEYDLHPELYSGGDECVLCRHKLSVRPISGSLYDDNIPSHIYDFQAPIRDLKIHMAGVTAVLPLQPVFHGEQVLLTGSYDEYVRVLLPVEGRSRPKVLAEERLGGGVWRLKILDFVAPDHGTGT